LILAFLFLGVEIAVTIIEFHLVTLIALVTVPFGILTQTAFLSERAIGYVASVGVKLMAIAIIVSIGETIFAQFTVSASPTFDEDCGLLLSGLLLLVLALKVPSIASALISGGPQLSAGAALTGAASLAAGVGGAALAARMGAGLVEGSLAKAAGAAAAAGALPSGPGGGPSSRGGSDGDPAADPAAAAYSGEAPSDVAARARRVQALSEAAAQSVRRAMSEQDAAAEQAAMIHPPISEPEPDPGSEE
jgi:type IV secretion system protein TrbL